MLEADGGLDGDPMSEAEPPQAATGGRGSEGGEQVEEATLTTAGVRGNEGGGEVLVLPQLRRETLPDTSLTFPSSAVVGEGTDLVIEETPTQVEDPAFDEWTKNL